MQLITSKNQIWNSLVIFLSFMIFGGCTTGSQSIEEKVKIARAQEIKAEQDKLAALKANAVPIIINHSTSDPNSAGGVDFEVEITNLAQKTLKYVRLTAIPYNAVGDKVRCGIRRQSEIDFEMTGPFEPDALSPTQGLRNAWYNPTIKCAKLTRVTLLYMDGSKVKVKNLESVQLPERPDCP